MDVKKELEESICKCDFCLFQETNGEPYEEDSSDSENANAIFLREKRKERRRDGVNFQVFNFLLIKKKV